MNKTKFLSLFLALVMVLGALMTACGGEEEQTSDVLTDNFSTEGKTETSAETNGVTDTESESESAADTESSAAVDTDADSESETLEITTEATTQPVETETEYWDERFDTDYAPAYYFSAKDIYNISLPGEFGVFKALSEVKITKDHSYTTLKAYAQGAEGCIPLVTEPIDVAPIVMVKYRTKVSGFYMEMFMDSVNSEATGGSNVQITVNADGYWNTAIINAGQKLSKVFDGKKLNYIRFDFVNGNGGSIPVGAYVDIAYIAFFDSVEDAEKFEFGEDYVAPEFKIDENSGYKLATVGHATCLEIVNGGAKLAGGLGGNSAKGPEVISGVTYTVENKVIISGWTVVEGGFDKIVWSADGGKTWNDAAKNVLPQFYNGGGDHINVAQNRIKGSGGEYTFVDKQASYTGCCYQGKVNTGIDCAGVAADLSAYEGKSVSLAFCAVPKSDPTALCPIVFFPTVRVGAPAEEETEETEVITEEVVEFPASDFSASVEEADKLSNKVQAYFDDADRSSLTVENLDVTYVFDLLNTGNQQIASLTGKNGGVFLKNTSDAFILSTTGAKYYASKTAVNAETNIYRQGFYYYDVHVYGADFAGGIANFDKKSNINPTSASHFVMTEKVSTADGVLTFKVTDAADPRVYFEGLKLKTEYFQYLEVTLKSTKSESGTIYLMNTGDSGYSSEKSVGFRVIADGEYHTYRIAIASVPGYKGNVTGMRFDLGSEVGEEFSIKSIQVMGSKGLPSFGFDRSLYIYSDKANQVMHLITPSDNENIASYGWETKIPANTVAKIIVGDKKGTHTTLDGVDWASATYVGFDIKNVGILGYILLDHEGSGALKVTLEDGNYVIVQSKAPKDGKVASGTEIYMGHRLYTKEGIHTFDDLIFEAYCEYNPLETVSTLGTSRNYRYVGYDALRGAYKFEVVGSVWNDVYLSAHNQHNSMIGQFKGDGKDRKIYVYTLGMGNSQTLECAVMLDGNGVIVPIALEVAKNFAGDGEANNFLIDIGYSEVIWPMVVKANETYAFNMLHLYQNWGKYPLKQIDSIQFYAPFYHLSTGVTETNCIRPWYDMNDKGSLYTLPDFRAMSATLWIDIFKESEGKILSNQPQHTNGGNHQFLQYKGEDGKMVYSENVNLHIGSYGPTYAEIDMDYITDDGKIKVTYKHLEMPQTDENRTYYEIRYEFLEDLTINNVLKEFTFYTVAGRNMNYQHLGYLNEKNECVITDTEIGGYNTYALGDQAPYFSLFEYKEKVGSPDLDDYENNYVNIGCLIYDYDVKIGGKSYDGGLAVYENGRRYNLTLNLDGKAEFKKGDTIALDLILVPWGDGYGMTDYESDAPDINVRKIRENSILDPFKVTVANGEKLDSVYLPRIKSTDGKSAEFTVSGGENNLTVRIYGIKKIARPVIYEKVNGEWVIYEVSSKNTPDKVGIAHDYDGYMIQYDGDGTYSYSFVTTITDGAARTFKIVVE